MFQWMATHIQATLIGLNGLKKQKDMKLWGEGDIRDIQEELDGKNERGCDQARCLFVWNSQRINKKKTLYNSSWWTVFFLLMYSLIHSTNKCSVTGDMGLIPMDLQISESQLLLVESHTKGHTVSEYLIACSLKFKTWSPQNQNQKPPSGLCFISTTVQCPGAAWTQLQNHQ